ncbi:SMP-30/gluconolactonase/LRE family protein [Paenibacillus sp. LjRoot153]|uniref:SMP-30/gluconolactonase/LRE family protein n=1 Tax=Paenibacillus sp. LjRoot153 TaxID=3342270 RepID=UPI003ECD5AEC
MNSPRVVADVKALLGEGPSWDAKSGKLYWVDILCNRLYVLEPSSGCQSVYDFDQMISAVVPRKTGGLMAVTEKGYHSLSLKDGKLIPIYDPEETMTNSRFNDGKCDPQGRFWAGTKDLEDTPGKGSLYRLDSDYSCRTMIPNVTISNGLAWSPDRTKMYYIDSAAEQVTAFDYDDPTGKITNPRCVIDFKPEEGWPDGMTIDTEGMLWIAHWNGWQVSRWNAQTGQCLERVSVPAALVTSCVFGGPALRTLYITTATCGLTEEEQLNQPFSGSLFAVETSIRGTPTYAFG